MSDSTYVAVSGALARVRELDVLANNLANADTVGFKRDRLVFGSTLESALRNIDGNPARGATGRAFVRSEELAIDFSAGGIEPTGHPLHVSIAGPGFFELEGPDGPRYTRSGAFVIDAERRLVSQDGRPVVGEDGPITLGDRPVEIRASGEVVDDREQALARLKVVEIDDPSRLEKVGENQFRAEFGVPVRTAEAPELVPRTLERSNVRPVAELAALMLLQRSFDISLQVLRTDDEVTQQLIREISQ